MSENVLPMFSSKNFMVSLLIFQSLSHFRFISVCGVRECSNFIGLHVTFHLFWASLIAQLVINPPAMEETLVRFLGQEDPPEKGKATHSSILALTTAWTI